MLHSIFNAFIFNFSAAFHVTHEVSPYSMHDETCLLPIHPEENNKILRCGSSVAFGGEVEAMRARLIHIRNNCLFFYFVVVDCLFLHMQTLRAKFDIIYFWCRVLIHHGSERWDACRAHWQQPAKKMRDRKKVLWHVKWIELREVIHFASFLCATQLPCSHLGGRKTSPWHF